MKAKYLAAVALLTVSGSLLARNEVKSVDQVSESVTVDTDIDYQITNAEPFGVNGSVNITDTEHGVLIIRHVKPSKVLANWMSHIYINGEAAVDGTNCQVKMYDRGAIILPYGKDFKPLTCYTETNYGGTSYDNYTEGSNGGYMKTMNTASLNNKVRSFKLKRGYMVTFATGTAGWGYSRVFIADQEDLEVPNVPTPLNGKISSYRLFKWWNAHKAGGASSGDYNFNQAINSCWCYDWAQGNASLLPDVEWVPNHIYEDYPSSATCGGVTGSCHMKTNNEPGNSADDHPQTVDVVLNNWQNLMRTGMRLCSESSHDGSWAHLNAFIDSIDARGWRCDLLDLHCYWGASSFGDFSWYYSSYGGRPVWISEWCWGASWNSSNWSSGGIFAQAPDGAGTFSEANQTCMLNGTTPILEKLNASKYVERYAFWNGENVASKIYYNGALTKLGQYYANMDEGLGYNADIQKVPTIVYFPISSFTGTYTKKSKTMQLSWTDPNGDMIDSMRVECKLPNSSLWKSIKTVMPTDKSSKDDNAYTFTDTLTDAGLYVYRIASYVGNAKKYISDETSCTVSAANAVGAVQYGQLKINDINSVTTDIEAQDKAPYVVTGMVSNQNTANGITNQVQTLSKSSFKFRFLPWTLTSPVSFDKAESVDYMVLPADTVYHLSDGFLLMSQKIGNVKNEEKEVTFPEAFPEGVTPIVVAQQNTSITSYPPVTVKVYDVTNTGFKVKMVRQEGVTGNFNAENVNYFAASPGKASIGGGRMLVVGRNDATPVGGSSRQTVAILDAAGDTLHVANPIIIAAPQTDNYAKASVFRLHSTTKDADGAVYQMSIRRQVDGTNTSVTESNLASKNGDYVGWIIICDDPNGSAQDDPIITGINSLQNADLDIQVENGIIRLASDKMHIYTAAGQEVSAGKKLAAGIYVVTDGKQAKKIQLK